MNSKRASIQNPAADIYLDANLELVAETQRDRRTYNLPTANEVAAIIPENAHGNALRAARPICLSLRYASEEHNQESNHTYE